MNAATARSDRPAAERNCAPILTALQHLLPRTGRALEIACGTGQHALHFAVALPGWHWLPTDADPAAVAVTAVRVADAGLARLQAPVVLDVGAPRWPIDGLVDAIYVANLLHIAPWSAGAGLMHGATRHLAPGGLLLIYGPFLIDGEPAAPSNLAFDADLRARDPAWGLRRLAAVVDAASAVGLVLEQRIAMPANNLLLVFARASSSRHGTPAHRSENAE